MATSRKGGTKRGHFSKTGRTTCHSPVSFPFFFFKGGPRIRVMLRPVSHRLPGGKTQRPHLSSRAALPPSLRSTAGIKARATAEESQLQGGLERSGHLLTGQVRARAEQALVSLPPVLGIRLSPPAQCDIDSNLGLPAPFPAQGSFSPIPSHPPTCWTHTGAHPAFGNAWRASEGHECHVGNSEGCAQSVGGRDEPLMSCDREGQRGNWVFFPPPSLCHCFPFFVIKELVSP